MGNVKVFRSTDFGAPVLYGAIGYMIPVLDACLVNGYGSQSITSLTHSGGTVTAVNAGHGLTSNSRQTISGVNESGYNGEFVITVINATTFTYQAAGITVNTATGTILTRSASAGWTKEFSGTNLAAYRPGAGIRHYLRVDDTTTISCRVVGYETMTAISTGTGPFPTAAQMSGGLYWRKSTTTDSTNARPWMIIADDTNMYIHVSSTSDLTFNSVVTYGFGDYISNKAGDAYNSYIIGASGATYSYEYFGYLSHVQDVTTASAFGMYSPRSYTQIGASVPLGKAGDYSKTKQTAMGKEGLPYPHPVDGGLYLKQIDVIEGASVGTNSLVRGTMKGVYTPLHITPLTHLDVFEGSGGLAGKRFVTWKNSHTAAADTNQCMIDISLTW